MVKTTIYMPGHSVLHRLDPRIKLLLLLGFTIEVFFIRTFTALGFMFFCILFLWKLARMPLKTMGIYVRRMAFFFLLLTVMQALSFPGKTIVVAPLFPDVFPLVGGRGKITLEGILMGLLLCWRVLTLVCLLPLLLKTTSIEKLALGMVRLGLPYKIAFTTTTALNQLPLLEEDLTQVLNAQKLRGFPVFEGGTLPAKLKALPSLVIPFVIGAMRRANMMGVAMDSRAFGSHKNRTYITSIKMKGGDWLFLTLGIFYMAGLLFLNACFQ